MPDGTTFYQKDRFYKVKSYVGLEAPKHLGGKILTYKICYGIACISITPSIDQIDIGRYIRTLALAPLNLTSNNTRTTKMLFLVVLE